MSFCVCHWFLAYAVVLLKVSDLQWPVNIGKGLWDNVLDRRNAITYTDYNDLPCSLTVLCVSVSGWDTLDFMGTVCISRSGLGWGWPITLLFYKPKFNAGNIHSTNTSTNNTPSSHRAWSPHERACKLITTALGSSGPPVPRLFISQRGWRNTARREEE